MKSVVLLLALILIVGIAVLVLVPGKSQSPDKIPTPSDNPTETSSTSTLISDSLANLLVANVLSNSKFSSHTSSFVATNLDTTDEEELIIGAIEPNSGGPAKATIVVIRPTSPEGDYELVGGLEYDGAFRGAPEIKKFQDITGDGIQEMLASLGYGGASNAAHGLLQLNSDTKSLSWIQLRDSSGNTRDAMFLIGGTVTHTEGIEIVDIDQDNLPEVIELFTQIWEPEIGEANIPNKKIGETWCLIQAYEWTGSFFDFSRDLSEQFLATLQDSCTPA